MMLLKSLIIGLAIGVLAGLAIYVLLHQLDR